MIRISRIFYLLALVMLACTASNTGNPAVGGADGGGSGDVDAPEGIVLVRSDLHRDDHPEVSDAELEQFAAQSREFAFDLYGQIANNEGNIFLSPYSVRVGLAMLYAGAEGQTEQEIAKTLHFELPEPILHAAFNAIDVMLEGRSEEVVVDESSDEPGATPSKGELELYSINAAFGSKDMSFKAPFLDTLALNYGTGMFAADFAGNAERERLAINRWVEAQTNDRIPGILPIGSIVPDVALVLVNALYFKGSWLEPFDPEETRDEMFHTPAGDVTIPMMNGVVDLQPYAEGVGYKALELPYVAPAIRMLFILPAEGSFEEVQAKLSREFVDQVRAEMTPESVTVKVPKFTIESSFELSDSMIALGMDLAFHPHIADLSDIAGNPGYLHVSKIYHKTFVAVDEQGTEASAATAIILRPDTSGPPTQFLLDRPFIFMIYDEPTGQVLFIGRVLDPS